MDCIDKYFLFGRGGFFEDLILFHVFEYPYKAFPVILVVFMYSGNKTDYFVPVSLAQKKVNNIPVQIVRKYFKIYGWPFRMILLDFFKKKLFVFSVCDPVEY